MITILIENVLVNRWRNGKILYYMNNIKELLISMLIQNLMPFLDFIDHYIIRLQDYFNLEITLMEN